MKTGKTKLNRDESAKPQIKVHRAKIVMYLPNDVMCFQICSEV